MSTPADAARVCRQVDLMPSYQRFAAATADMPADARATRFATSYAPRHRDFYFIPGSDHPADVLASARRFFTGGATRPGMRPLNLATLDATGRETAAQLPAIQRDFLAAFPDFRCDARLMLGVSLDRFDGSLVRDHQGARLLIGVDLVQRMHDPATFRALVHHELFHLYHAQVVGPQPRDIPLWWQLWLEGLAIHASATLNPDLGEDRLLFYPPGIVERTRPRVAELAAAMLAAFDATGPATRDYFAADENARGLPPRAGYYLGYMLAKELGRTRSPAELARLPAAEVEPLVRAFLSLEAQGHH